MCLVFTMVFVIGMGTLAAIFYALSRLERDDSNNQNLKTSIGESSSGTTISMVGSRNLDELSTAPTHHPIRSIVEIVKLSGPLERNTVLLSVLKQSDEEQVLDLLGQTRQLDPPARLQTQAFIVQKLSRINPLRALSEVQQFQPPRVSYLLTALFSEWVQIDLDTAVSQAKTLNHAGKLAALEGILRERSDLSITERLEIARQLGYEQYAIDVIEQEIVSEALDEPARIWKEIVEEAENEPKQIEFLTEIAKVWVDKMGIGVLDQVRKSLNNFQTKSLITTAVLRDAARSNPSTAFEYALSMDSDPKNNSKLAVLQKWAETDPHSVLDAMSSLEQKGQYVFLLERLVQTWASFYPRSLLANLDYLPNHVVNSATKLALIDIAESLPQEAAEFVSSMEDEKDDMFKLELARTVFNRWSGRDLDAALDWILNDASMKGLRSRVLTHAMFSLMNGEHDAERVLNVALALPIGENEIGPEAVVIAQIASEDIDKAIEYSAKVRDGPTKTEAYSCVGYVLAQKKLTLRALELAKQVPDYAQEEYLAQVLGGWAMYHPLHLFESIDELPSKEIASTAAFSLLFYEPQSEHLSEDQIETVKTYLTEEDARQLE